VQHQDRDILTIGDSSEDEELGEMDTSGRDVCPSGFKFKVFSQL